MQTPYWQKMEIQPSFKEWKEFYDGCLMCACDHGCNQWLKEQQARASLLFDAISTPGSTKPDKIAQMSLERVNKIWYRLVWWKAEKFNRELRKLESNEQNEKGR